MLSSFNFASFCAFGAGTHALFKKKMIFEDHLQMRGLKLNLG